jgi:hypothetical protein
MQNLTYKDLVARYGNAQAYGLLLTFEKLAKIKHDIMHSDEDIRFQKALEELSKDECVA